MKLCRWYLTKNNCYIAAKKATQKGILVHDTGAGNKKLSRYIDNEKDFGVNKYGNHWNQPKPNGINVCVHAFIGEDKNGNVCTCETLPYEYSGWGCGAGTKGSYNYDPNAHIQFEICDDGYNDNVVYDRFLNVYYISDEEAQKINTYLLNETDCVCKMFICDLEKGWQRSVSSGKGITREKYENTYDVCKHIKDYLTVYEVVNIDEI